MNSSEPVSTDNSWLNLIFENDTTGISIISSDGKFIKANRTCCTISGYTREDLLNRTVFDLTPLDQKQSCQDHFNYLFSRETGQLEFDQQIVTKSGIVKNIRVKGNFIENGAKQLLAFVSEISNKKSTCEQLRKSQKELALAQEVAHIGSWTLDLQTEEVSWSAEMYRILEIPYGEKPPNDKIADIIHPEDRDVFTQKMNKREEFSNLEIRHITPSGIKILCLNTRLMHEGGQPLMYYGTIQDVTEARQMEMRIRDAQQIAKLGWWEVNLTTGEAIWSDAIYDIMGLKKGENPLTFEEYKAQLHPEDQKYLEMDLGQMPEGWSNFVLRCKGKNGRLIYVLTSGKVVFDGKIPVRIMGTNMDITETMEAQEKLKQAQQIAKIGWYEYDLLNSKNHRISEEVYDLLDLPPTSGPLDADKYISRLAPDDRDHFLYRINNIDKYPNGWDNHISRIVTPQGNNRYLQGSARVAYEKDKPIRIFGTLYDVTQVKNVEQELETREIDLKALITFMENLVFVINDQCQFEKVFCNDPTLLTRPAEEFLGKTIHDVWQDEPNKTIAVMIRQALSQNKPASHIYQHEVNNKKSWWQAHIKPIKGKYGRTWAALIINDITAKKNAEEELIRGIQKEKELSELRSQFVSMASHQFRTPITVIKSNIELLEMSTMKDPLINKVTNRLQIETDRLVDLMENVMAMGRVQSGNIRVKPEPVKLSQLILRCKMNIERELSDQRTARLEVFGEEKQVNVDVKFIEHAINNLIDNAFKYSPKKEPPVIRLNYLPEKVKITVRDYGIGVPKKEINRLFSVFHRCSNTEEIHGTGLGLATAKAFVELNNGAIYHNEKAEGATEFCIELPLNEGERDE